MEQDAALVNRNFVEGKIMWLPKKAMIEPSDMPDLDDELFDHPVVIISEKGTEIVRVLIMTSFDGMGLDLRHRNSFKSLLYAPVHPAPKHPHIVGCTSSLGLQLRFNGHAKTFKKPSWVNLRRSYSVPYECLNYWQPWKGKRNKNLTLEKESYVDLMRYLRGKVPFWKALVEEKEKQEEEKRKREEKRKNEIRLINWRIRQQPQMSKSASAEMMRDYRYGTQEAEEKRKKEKSRHRCSSGYRDHQHWQKSGTQIPGQNVQEGSRAAATISDDPPKSKSISAMIPGPRSHIHKMEEEGKKEKENERSKPSRGLEAQPLQQPGTETTGNIVRSYVSALTTTTSADAPGVPTSTFPATTSDTWSSKHLSTTPPRKRLVLAPTSRGPRQGESQHFVPEHRERDAHASEKPLFPVEEPQPDVTAQLRTTRLDRTVSRRRDRTNCPATGQPPLDGQSSKQGSWQPLPQPGTETPEGTMQSDSGAVTATADAPALSVGTNSVMVFEAWVPWPTTPPVGTIGDLFDLADRMGHPL